jgi:hypothetical protein
MHSAYERRSMMTREKLSTEQWLMIAAAGVFFIFIIVLASVK